MSQQQDRIQEAGGKKKKEKKTFEEEYNELARSKFKQQKLPACRPVPSFKSTIIIFICFGVAFLVLGIILFILSDNLYEEVIRYDDTTSCSGNAQCTINLQIKSKLSQPIYFYYELDNFYQNHRLYVQSKDSQQLAGNIRSVGQLSTCDPVVKNSDLDSGTTALDGSALVPDEPANPCGLIAKSYFTGITYFSFLDTYSMKNSTGDNIPINENNISWQSDRDQRYKHAPGDYRSFQWIDVEDGTNLSLFLEHFIVWMRTAGLPNFRKLWGKIEQDLEPDTYTISVNNNYAVSQFGGAKKVVLAQTNFLGGRNLFLAYCYIVVGVLCLVFAIIFIVTYKYTKK